MSINRKATKLDRAKTALVSDHPFFATILMKRGMTPRMDIPTAAVDQRGNIYYNPSFVESLTVPQAVFLLAHEVGHVIAQHAARRGSRSPRRWNIAGDAWINDMLRDAKVGEFIDGGVDMPGSKDKTTEQIYNELPDDRNGGGGEQDPQGPGGIGEDLIEEGPPLTKEEAERLDAEMRVTIAEAAQAAKAQGKLHGTLAEIVADLVAVHTPWYDILSRFMESFARGDYSWSRPNRRYISQGYYLPSIGRVAHMGVVVVQIDVSGSISKAELDHYNAHMKRIIEQCHPEKVHVLYTDTTVLRHDEFDNPDEFELRFYSGGGTYMPAGFDYLDDSGIEPEVFICLTDGYTDFGSPPSYPVIWCISTDVVAQYGETVHFEITD